MGGLSGILKSVFGDPDAPIKAGEIQAAASREGIAETRRQFDVTQEQLAPFREAGLGALSQQQALLGLSGQEAQQAAIDQFNQSPGQRFLQQRAERSLLRNQGAIGGLGGGNVRSALQEQAVGFGRQEFQDQLSRLAGISGAGQTATTNIAQLGAQSSGNISNLMSQSGQAQAGGILGANQIRAGFGSTLLGAGAGAGLGHAGMLGKGVGAGGGALVGLLSDKNMKTDIQDLSLKECFDLVMNMPLKTWRYLDEVGLGTDVHLGPLAQEAPDIIKMDGEEMLNLHDELILIAGAVKYAHQEGICRL